MKPIIITTVITIFLAAACDTAFASGYGPAPFYRPSVESHESKSIKDSKTASEDLKSNDTDSYGGSNAVSSDSGNREATSPAHPENAASKSM